MNDRRSLRGASAPFRRSLAGVCCTAMLAGVLAVACTEEADRPGGAERETTAHPDRPRTDRDPLAEAPEQPIGSDGFSHYVYRDVRGRLVPTLVEGPSGAQVRCQDERLPCSYLELKALYDSSAEIPEELHMTREELGDLVGQLDTVWATLARYKTIDDACAAGYRVRGTQKANMGIHMMKPGLYREFDPADPHIVLFGKNGGEEYERDEIGHCQGDRWEGEEGYQVVGAAYMVPLADEHPAGFAGPLDNWHLHFNACVDSNAEPMVQYHGLRDECEAAGGIYQDPSPWMIHVYAVPEFDAQFGVFAMHNASIWPVATRPESLEDMDEDVMAKVHDEGALYAPINNFSFGSIAARPGQKIVFANWDGVPHTVTAGTPEEPTREFDSGALGTGEAFEVAFDEPGEYRLFCKLHPSMTATVVIE